MSLKSLLWTKTNALHTVELLSVSSMNQLFHLVLIHVFVPWWWILQRCRHSGQTPGLQLLLQRANFTLALPWSFAPGRPQDCHYITLHEHQIFREMSQNGRWTIGYEPFVMHYCQFLAGSLHTAIVDITIFHSMTMVYIFCHLRKWTASFVHVSSLHCKDFAIFQIV